MHDATHPISIVFKSTKKKWLSQDQNGTKLGVYHEFNKIGITNCMAYELNNNNNSAFYKINHNFVHITLHHNNDMIMFVMKCRNLCRKRNCYFQVLYTCAYQNNFINMFLQLLLYPVAH